MHPQLLIRLLVLAWLFCMTACTGTTQVEEDAFRLSLPGRWSGGFEIDSGAWVYLTASGEEGITVNVVPRPVGIGTRGMELDFDAYLQQQRREQQLGDEPMALTVPRVSRTRRRIDAMFEGVGTVSQRRTRTLVIVNEVAAASFYYEAFGLPAAQFDERADAIMDEVHLAP
jgi:hypothetical protein